MEMPPQLPLSPQGKVPRRAATHSGPATSSTGKQEKAGLSPRKKDRKSPVTPRLPNTEHPHPKKIKKASSKPSVSGASTSAQTTGASTEETVNLGTQPRHASFSHEGIEKSPAKAPAVESYVKYWDLLENIAEENKN